MRGNERSPQPATDGTTTPNGWATYPATCKNPSSDRNAIASDLAAHARRRCTSPITNVVTCAGDSRPNAKSSGCGNQDKNTRAVVWYRSIDNGANPRSATR